MEHDRGRAAAAVPDGDLNDDVTRSAARDGNATGKAYFQCGYCKKNYGRADHLVRHVRSHTREKPYACHVCNKSFSRLDLVKRHMSGHSNENQRKRKRAAPDTSDGRVSQACKSCAASKLKCDQVKPCRRCRDKNVVCDFVPEGDPSLLPSPTFDQEETDQHRDMTSDPEGGDEFGNDPEQINAIIDDSNFPQPDLIPQTSTQNPRADLQIGERFGTRPEIENGALNLDDAFMNAFSFDVSIPSLAPYVEASPFDYYARSKEMELDFGLTDYDMSLIESMNDKQAVFHSDYLGVDGQAQQADNLSETDSGIAMGADAYHRSSLVCWTPGHEDHYCPDQDNLSVPRAIDRQESTTSPSNRHVFTDPLTYRARDLIFGMVLQNCRRADLSRIMSSFPSTELLDNLLHKFYDYHQSETDQWIHVPTFEPNKEDPEIVAVMAAAGASHSPIPAVKKLGLALMEVVRGRLGSKYDEDNSVTRRLRESQALALTLEIGLWSGNQRKTEIAESFLQTLVTMLRRARRFRRSLYTPISLTDDDDGPTLDAKWREWAHRESFKRLVYHMFIHDSRSSTVLSTQPIISYAELDLPLPERRELWEAKTAAEWKLRYVADPNLPSKRLPSLSDLLRDISQLSMFQDAVDSQVTALIVLHGITALVTEYHRLRYMSRNQSPHWQELVTNSRHQEICQALQCFRMVSSDLQNDTFPDILVVCEMVAMSLHMDLAELQLFAGKEDKDEAYRVYQRALEWISSIDSRRAIWHAGQIVRAARRMPSGSLSGFLAVVVYYAGLAFWCYNVVSRAKERKVGNAPRCIKTLTYPQTAQTAQTAPPIVYLDKVETVDLQRFISLGRGFPALTGDQGPVFLNNPSATMDLVRGVLRSDVDADSLPPLVQSLCQLMCDLGRAASEGP